MRVIGKPRGNMLLIGIGGSGRQSLTRLAAYLIGYKVFQIEVTRNYKKAEFRDGMDQAKRSMMKLSNLSHEGQEIF